jgi:hypothetical protein
MVNFVRMGILRGKGKALFGPAKFLKHVHLLGDAQIARLHKTLVTHIVTMPFGPFHATAHILGQQEAISQAARQEFILPPCFVHNTSSTSLVQLEQRPPKRVRHNQTEYIDINMGDDEEEEEEE